MDKNDSICCTQCHDTQFDEDPDYTGIKYTIVLILLLLCSILCAYLINNPFGSYIPIMLIAIFQWYRSFTRQTRSYYGLCRLLLFILVINLWDVFILRLSIQSIALLLGYRHIEIAKIQHLFPYTLMFTALCRNKPDMNLNDKRRYIIHLLYDIPAFILVMIFKLLNNPLNALYSEITPYCYLGCLPTSADAKKLNEIGIKNVVNLCAEYNGPRKTYEKYQIKQLHLPTVDSTAPSLKTMEQAIEFMKEASMKKEKIFVHCKAGLGRSAVIVLCHLVANENMSPENALQLIKEKRPEVVTTIVDYATVKRFFARLRNNKTQ